MNFNCKNAWTRCICYETKASIHWSQCREWIYGAQSLKEWRLIQKMVEREVFLMKPKHENLLSQWGECVYAT